MSRRRAKATTSRFRLKSRGRHGTIVLEDGERSLEIEWDPSGSRDYAILLAPVDLSHWTTPAGVPISLDKQIEILGELRVWLVRKKIKTDVDRPTKLVVVDKKCVSEGCKERQMEGSAHCPYHYDLSLLCFG